MTCDRKKLILIGSPVDCCHKSSKIVFLPKFDEENVQMSRLDAFSLKHSAILLRIKKAEIYYQNIYLSNPAPCRHAKENRSSQKLKFSVSFKLKVKP